MTTQQRHVVVIVERFARFTKDKIMSLLPAGHISIDMIKDHAKAYLDTDTASRKEDVLWLMRNAGPQDALNLLTFGYLLATLPD